MKEELEALAHTLNDIKTVLECNVDFAQKALQISENLKPRIKMLEQRIDEMAKEEVKDEGKNNRQTT